MTLLWNKVMKKYITFNEAFSGYYIDDDENTGYVDFNKGDTIEAEILEHKDGKYAISIPLKYVIEDIPDSIINLN